MDGWCAIWLTYTGSTYRMQTTWCLPSVKAEYLLAKTVANDPNIYYCEVHSAPTCEGTDFAAVLRTV